MEKKRIVITGIGVVAPNGIGKEEFWRNCAAGVSGIKSITLFDVSKYRCRYAGEISNFQPEKYLGPKGLRNLDRTTLLSLVAAKLAIEDAKLEITDDNRNDIGVVLGSTVGSVHSISEFDKEGLREGPRYVNPAHFPNTVINSPASQVAIRFGLRGVNSTIATGFTASLDAIGYAMNMLMLGRAKALLVGGVEELCIQTFLGFYKNGFLATTQDGSRPFFEPFHPKCSGTLLGEGSAFFVLEPLEEAEARGATIYSEVLGYGTCFEPDALYQYDPEAKGPIGAINESLHDAGLDPERIDHISACANSTKIFDATEQTALETVFGRHLRDVSVTASKSLLGESFSTGAALQLVALCGALVHQKIFAGNGQRDRAFHVSSRPSTHMSYAEPEATALIDSFGPTGVSSVLVLRWRNPDDA